MDRVQTRKASSSTVAWSSPLRRRPSPAAEHLPLHVARHFLGNRGFGQLLQNLAMSSAAEETTATRTGAGAGPIAAPVPASTAGEPLTPHARALLEPAVQGDLSGVRLHSGPEADAAAERLGARAFTIGQDVFFGIGEPDPATERGARLLTHELAHTVQQQTGQPRIARDATDQATSTGSANEPPAPVSSDTKTAPVSASDTKRPAAPIHFGSPKLAWYVLDPLIWQLPKRWQDAYHAAKATGDEILFEPKLGYDLAYREVMAALNLFYAGVYSGISPYRPGWSNALKVSESLSGVGSSYINLFSLALRLDLDKYIKTDLTDQARSNLGWAIIYGLALQGALVGINAANKDDLDFTSLLGEAVKSFTETPLGLGRPYAIANPPDARWSSYPFGSGSSGMSAKLGGAGDDTKPYSFSLNLGFNLAAALDLYPAKPEDKPKYKGLELYPYFKMQHSWRKSPDNLALDPSAPLSAGRVLDPTLKDNYLAGVFFGDHGVYTLLEGGEQRIAATGDVAETYFRTGLAFRDLGPITSLQASGEFDTRPQDPKVRERINAATSISIVDNRTWQLIVGGSLGYLFPKEEAPGAFDYGGQLALFHKYQREKKDPLKTGVDISASYHNQDPFVATSPHLFSLKGSLTLFDFFRFSLEYHDISGAGLDPALPKSETRFMVFPGPGMFTF